jgi:hypothetical protein
MAIKQSSILDIRLNKELDKKTAEHFLGFSFGNLNLGNCITHVLPKLEVTLSLPNNKKSKLISEEVGEFYKTFADELEEKTEEFKDLWGKTERNF